MGMGGCLERDVVEPPKRSVGPVAASVLPPGMLRTSTRLRVLTRARARSATRVGLTFEQVEIEPRALLGFDLSQLLPALSLPLPRLPGSNRAGADSDTSPAFFDVLYLDINRHIKKFRSAVCDFEITNITSIITDNGT